MKILMAVQSMATKVEVEAICRSHWPHCEVVYVGDRARLLSRLEDDPPDVVLLDTSLGRDDGYAVCGDIRAFSAVPVIMMAGGEQGADAIKAVEWGADFLLRRPLQASDLLASITALVRRVKRQPLVSHAKPFRFGDLYVDFNSNDVRLDGNEVKLTLTEQAILRCLAFNANQTLPSSRLAWLVWGDDSEASLDSLRVHIKNLRQKFGESATNPRFIVSERGVGYRFVTRPRWSCLRQPARR